MPKCCVPYCTSGYKNARQEAAALGVKPPSLFAIPKELLLEYQRSIKRDDVVLTTKHRVCSLHFSEDDIERFHPDVVIDGKLVAKGSPRKIPKLREGAKPCVFPTYPKYLATTSTFKRKSSKSIDRNPLSLKKTKLNTNTEAISNPISSPLEYYGISPEVQEGPQQDLLHEATDYNRTECDFSTVQLPGKDWAFVEVEGKKAILKINEALRVTHSIAVTEDKIEVKIGGKAVRGIEGRSVQNNAALEEILLSLNKLKLCGGSILGRYHKNCRGWVSGKALRCPLCRNVKNGAKKEKQSVTKRSNTPRWKYVTKQSRRRLSKIQELKKAVKALYMKCNNIEKNKLEDNISHLSQEQQQMILTCHRAASLKGPKGSRYQLNWVYECMLMRVKSPALYRHIRLRKILPLPSRATLNRYMKKLHPMYGYQDTMFAVLRKKTENWEEADRHGVIVVDEMKITEGVGFDKTTLRHWGMVNLGNHTPLKQKDDVADHALVVMMQRFQGKWHQPLGCFLSKGNVSGDVLAKLILEGITLCEEAGLMIDGVVTDGATWNRNMWQQYGVDANNPSCAHPCEDGRRLWFFSDWCHLLKCMRNSFCQLPPRGMTKKESKLRQGEEDEYETQEAVNVDEMDIKVPTKCSRSFVFKETPDGLVQRKHWVALLNEEEKLSARHELRYVPNISRKHIFPTGFQRMNVAMAYQFFSNATAKGMEWYRKKGVPQLQDSESTQKFIERVDRLGHAVNSGGPTGALWDESKEEKEILEFIDYHKKCIALAQKNGSKSVYSESTDLGLLVTLQSTIGVSRYLRDKLNFTYVMTKRLNQDCLEQFFGNIRRMAAPNPHPDSKLFAQLFRLISLYSLVSPAKGSAISGASNVEALVNAKDSVGQETLKRNEEFNNLIDEILEFGSPLDQLPVPNLDHNYGVSTTQSHLISFMAGFTAFRQKKIVKNCDNCLSSLTKQRSELSEDDNWTVMKEVHDGYSIPSESLKALISSVESAVCEVTCASGIHDDMVFTTLKNLKINSECFVGCSVHAAELTKALTKYYLFIRMYFSADMKNAEMARQQEKRKLLRKQSKA